MAPDQNERTQIYKQLDYSREEIRLLEILETSPSIHCKLSTVSLQDSPEYCTLSYVWGKPSDIPPTIFIDDVTMSITQSLFDALVSIQSHWKTAFPNRHLTNMRLWADAICINQTDNTEKNYQVPLMKKIYSSSAMTFGSLDLISLGSKIPTSLETWREIATYLETKNFNKFWLDSSAMELLGDLPVPKRAQDPISRRSHESERRDGPQLPPDWDLTFREDVETLLHLTYWKRAWIFQELVLSKKVTLYYANHSIGFHLLENVWQWASKVTALPRPETYPLTSWGPLHKISSKTLGQTVFARAFLDEHTDIDFLQALCFYGALLKATNPKDHIYALVGVANVEMIPRYENTASIASVYIEYSLKCIDAARKTSTEPLRFLQFGGISNGNPGEHELPSWVPNFPYCADKGESSSVPCLYLGARQSRRSWEGSIGSITDVSIRSQSLHSTCLFITTSEALSDVPYSKIQGSSKMCETKFVGSIFKILQCAIQATERPQTTNQHPFLKLTNAFFPTKNESFSWHSPEVLHLARVLQYILIREPDTRMELLKKSETSTNTFDMVFGVDFLNSIFGGVNEMMDAYIKGDIDDDCLRIRIQLGAELIDLTPLMDLNTASAAFKDILGFTRGFRVAQTSEFEFALVPPEAQAGDRIVLLTGYHELSLIRKVDDYYVLVGPVGCDDRIVERKLHQLELGEVKLEPIEIR